VLSSQFDGIPFFQRGRSRPIGDFDSPWKEALDRFFEAFMAFFFPMAYAEIDWSRGYAMLDKEMLWVVLAMGVLTHLPIRQVYKHARRMRPKENTPSVFSRDAPAERASQRERKRQLSAHNCGKQTLEGQPRERV
jgi:hypothetical protein